MARRAVQGYSEKSYYENGRFLGLLATNDPLQEGYLKHLVNFDIADTGLSIKPRKGFLTTTLAQYTPAYTIPAGYTNVDRVYNLSTSTPQGTLPNPANHTEGDYVLWTTGNPYGLYILTGGQWVLVNDSVELSVLSNPTEDYMYLAGTQSVYSMTYADPIDVDPVTTYIPLSTSTIIYKDSSTQEYVVYDLVAKEGYLCDISRYKVINNIMPVSSTIGNLDWSNVYTYLVDTVPEIKTIQTEFNTSTLFENYIQSILSIYKHDVVSMVNSIGIKKTVVKVRVHDDEESIDHIFFLAMYYRESSSVILNLAADTLVFEAINMTEHPDYTTFVHNIASGKSIIPADMQTLYEATYDGEGVVLTTDRPDGHTSNVSPLIYTKNAEDKYITKQIYRGVNYIFKPYFSLNPPGFDINDSTAKWAYRFDIHSTKSYKGDPNEGIICRGNWLNYDATNARVFEPSGMGAHDFTNEDLKLRHYNGTRYIIMVIPELVQGTIVYDKTAEPPEALAPGDLSGYTLSMNQSTWITKINDMSTRKTIREQIATMAARFIVIDLHQDPGHTANADFLTDVMDVIKGQNVNVQEDYETMSITALELAEMIDNDSFVDHNFTFRLFAGVIAAEEAGVGGSTYRWYFIDNNYMVDPDGQSIFTVWDRYGSLYTSHKFNDAGLGIDLDTILSSPLFPDLKADGFFDNGIAITFYMRPYEPTEINKTAAEIEVLKVAWESTPYVASTNLSYGYDSLAVTYVDEIVEIHPTNIETSKDYIVYNDNTLVTWKGNTLYISEPGVWGYFKDINKKEFDETIYKVIVFKESLLVFTAQHLYAVFQVVEERLIPGTEPPVTESYVYWAKQKVLYNILTDLKYVDAIKVFNEFVLFYSADGQLFLIKPNTMIDSETRFNLKYFNQGANDILLNYTEYINERLANYNINHSVVKEDVQIKTQVSINFIKIYYYVPGYITYILLFDVINNRFYVYDTIAFTDIHDKMFIDSGDLILTKHQDKLYFTIPYKEANTMDANVDMSVVNNFKKIAISGLVDTGNLNLNNHLRKRFDMLHNVFKNLSTSKLLYNVETIIDDIVSHPFYDTQLEVHDIGGISYYVTVPKTDNNDLIDLIGANQISASGAKAFKYVMDNNSYEDDSILMDFAEFTSSKLLTHRASIRGMGKVLRIKMQFISKGDFKIQSFGVVYKERRL